MKREPPRVCGRASQPRLEDRVMVRAGWGRRLSMAAMGVAAALVLAVGGVGTARVASDLLSGSGDDGGALLGVSGPDRGTGRRSPAPTRSWPSTRMTKR